MKVYILTSYGGTYKDKWSRIEGVYTDPGIAEEVRASLMAAKKAILDTPCPFDEEDENLTREQKESIWEWQVKIDNADGFCYCDVKEYETIPSEQK